MPKRDELTAAATPASTSGAFAVSAGNVKIPSVFGVQRASDQEIAEKQRLAWEGYDNVGELHFLANGIIGSSLETLAWYPAYVDEAPSYTFPPPVSNVDDVSEEDKATVRRLVEGYKPTWGSQEDLIKALGINLFFAGEVYVYSTRSRDVVPREIPPGGWYHQLIPKGNIQEAEKRPNGKVVQKFTDPFTSAQHTTGDAGNLMRYYRPHPANPQNCDSPVFPIIDLIEELTWIQRMVKGLFKKRVMTSGLLVMTNSILGPDYDPTDSSSIAGAVNSVEQQIIDQLSRSMANDTDSPALPIMLFAPFEHIDKGFKYIEIAGELPETTIKERREVLRRMANSLDVPAEFVLGLGDVNHWSAWLIRDLLWSQHIQPLATLIGNSVTTTFLRPELRRLKSRGQFSADPERFKMWFQQHMLATHPDSFQHFISLYDRGVIGKEVILRALGVPPDRAITDEEFELWLQLKLASLGTSREASELDVEDGRIVMPDGTIEAPSRQREGNSPNEGPANQDRAGGE